MDLSTAFLSPEQVALAAVVWGVVYVFTTAGLPTRWAPLSSLAVGLGLAFLVPSATWQLTVLAGLTIGLVAGGAHSGVKATVGLPSPSVG